MDKIAVWKPVEYPGMEYLSIDESYVIHINSVVIGVENGTSPFRLNYHLTLNHSWGAGTMKLAAVAKGTLELTRDTEDTWFGWLNGIWKPLPELDGCIDVDISATPFTNTLPIRRIHWQVGQSEVFKMVYIQVPDLTVSVDPQRYTCLAQSDHGATFRYESLDSDFSADITVDSDGLVLNYPGLFERVV
ncbi:MAG: hypothetical protein GC204_16265 [Chloroflexi bacterium]|nr:hypothetical protein [Chloroflexota bacterium]